MLSTLSFYVIVNYLNLHLIQRPTLCHMAHRGVAQEKALRLMLRPAADHRVHQDYISDHLELTGERKEEEEELSKLYNYIGSLIHR